MSQMRANVILDASGGNNAQINGALAVNTTNLRTQLNASGAAPIYACRAWVNFNGVSGAVIRASGNVSSVIRNGAGDYTVNFATAMEDANYSAVVTSTDLVNGFVIGASIVAMSNTSVRFRCQSSNHGGYDGLFVNVAIFR